MKKAFLICAGGSDSRSSTIGSSGGGSDSIGSAIGNSGGDSTIGSSGGGSDSRGSAIGSSGGDRGSSDGETGGCCDTGNGSSVPW